MQNRGGGGGDKGLNRGNDEIELELFGCGSIKRLFIQERGNSGDEGDLHPLSARVPFFTLQIFYTTRESLC